MSSMGGGQLGHSVSDRPEMPQSVYMSQMQSEDSGPVIKVLRLLDQSPLILDQSPPIARPKISDLSQFVSFPICMTLCLSLNEYVDIFSLHMAGS